MNSGAQIYGIGTDLCRVSRIAAALERHGDRFAERILTAHEMGVYRKRKALNAQRGVVYVATRFAAKEAFSKAVGLGMRSPMTWRSCETYNLPSGAPSLRFHGELAQLVIHLKLRAHVSMTDEREMVSAFVVLERLRLHIDMLDVADGST